ncbi:MAG: dihydroorotase [Firmicutes bacterium]|nr:dihydroorotase [Bacillota bacterium]
MRWLLKGGRVIDPSRDVDAVLDVLVEGDRIAAIGPDLAGPAQELDCRGKLVVPGLVDLRAHLGEPGREEAETVASATRAAAAGGFTALGARTATDPTIDDPALVAFVQDRARRSAAVRVYPLAALTKGRAGIELTEMGALRDAGAAAFSDDDRPVTNAGVLRRAMEYASMFDVPIMVHCEDPDLAGEGVMHEGFHSTIHGLRGIPGAAEEVLVARDLILAELTGARVHISHVTTARSVALIREAKRRGIRVTADVTPHHLILTDEDVQPDDARWKIRPPLRPWSDVEALREGLRDGTIDCIATDHMPHPPAGTELEFDQAPWGIIGLETALPIVLDRLVGTGALSLKAAVRAMSTNPARLLGAPGGTLELGAPADIAVIDPEAERVYDPAEGYSRSRNTPFAGWALRGWPVATMVAGRWVVQEGRVIG